MELLAPQSVFNKLEILTDAAKYDVACTSSGVDRKGKGGGGMGNAVAAGICHSFSADGRCISLLKVLYTNECVFDCKYCVNRSSNDVPRVSFAPDELAELTISFYRRNYIEGLFLSSGIWKSPNFTMEQIYEALSLLRNHYQFHGYVHVKAIPGADPAIIEKIGWLADRMSVNLELPTAEGLRALAPHKSRKTILRPMKQIQLKRNQDMGRHGELPFHENPIHRNGIADQGTPSLLPAIVHSNGTSLAKPSPGARFVPAGQSTQMIIGATGESDYEIINVAEALYQRFDLKRVFYSAFVNTTSHPSLPMTLDGPPLLREHRLYQADWLMRFYGFQANEILTPDHPDLNVSLDPKCNWAINNLEFFPVEIQTASYNVLLRVPGIGPNSARRIVAARRTAKLDFTDLKKIGVVLKRAMYFVVCNGKTMLPLQLNQSFIRSNLLGLRERLPTRASGNEFFEQLSLFEGSGTS